MKRRVLVMIFLGAALAAFAQNPIDGAAPEPDAPPLSQVFQPIEAPDTPDNPSPQSSDEEAPEAPSVDAPPTPDEEIGD